MLSGSRSVSTGSRTSRGISPSRSPTGEPRSSPSSSPIAKETWLMLSSATTPLPDMLMAPAHSGPRWAAWSTESPNPASCSTGKPIAFSVTTVITRFMAGTGGSARSFGPSRSTCATVTPRTSPSSTTASTESKDSRATWTCT